VIVYIGFHEVLSNDRRDRTPDATEAAITNNTVTDLVGFSELVRDTKDQ